MGNGRVGRFPDGALIFRQGDPADAMYVIKSGRVGIFRRQDGRDVQIGTCRAGDCFGEMALFDDKPRSATARSVGDAEIEIVTLAEFRARVTDPAVWGVLTRLSERVRRLDETVDELRAKAAE